MAVNNLADCTFRWHGMSWVEGPATLSPVGTSCCDLRWEVTQFPSRVTQRERERGWKRVRVKKASKQKQTKRGRKWTAPQKLPLDVYNTFCKTPVGWIYRYMSEMVWLLIMCMSVLRGSVWFQLPHAQQTARMVQNTVNMYMCSFHVQLHLNIVLRSTMKACREPWRHALYFS